jgi:hypothetical protein
MNISFPKLTVSLSACKELRGLKQEDVDLIKGGIRVTVKNLEII